MLTTGIYLLRLYLCSTLQLYDYNIKFYINGSLIISNYSLVKEPSYLWNVYQFPVSISPQQYKLLYKGLNYSLSVISSNQNIFNCTPFLNISANTNINTIFNTNAIGNWFITINNNINSTINTYPFSLIVTPILLINPYYDGFYYNTTIKNYTKNCYNDLYSIYSNSPTNLSSCQCKSNFIWDNSL